MEPARSEPTRIEPSAFEPLGSAPPPRRSERRGLRWALGAAVLCAVALLWFLFSARSLEVQVTAQAEVDISVSGLAVPFGSRYLLLPGEHRVSASAPGYEPLQTSVTVTDEQNQRLALALAPLPGRLDIRTTPAEVQVTLDGEVLGRTPLQGVSVSAGSHRLELSAERYRGAEQDIEVTGRGLAQQFEFALEPAWADIALASTPAGAQVLVDGEPAGTTPATLQVVEGERQLILRSPGYADWVHQLEVIAGQAQDLGSIELQPAVGLLQLTSTPAGANVTLDGEFLGQTPLEVEVTPERDHQLAVFKPGYRRHSETLRMPAASRDSREIALRAQLGEVAFVIAPAEAELRIDGRTVGRGSQVLSLPAVAHRVEVVLPGYNTQRQQVTPRPGLQQKLEITLRTDAEARAARTPSKVTSALGQSLLLFRPADSPTADFTMGASRREPGRRANEVLHPVSLRRAFYLQTTEVTNAQFRQYRKEHNSGQIEGNSLNRDQQPAVQVSWQQAASFCNWLSRREGLAPFYIETRGVITGFDARSTGYRLPSEAEWAWAARSKGADLLRFPWGDVFPPKEPVGNYADNSSAYITGRFLAGYEDGHVVSAPVTAFGANALGLYDMGHNVAEWTNDAYSIPSGTGEAETDPLGAQSGDNYVIRGAGWSHSRIGELRLSYRDYGQAGRDDVGFRLARYAE
ncbi:PEGA domain-containing protein [Mangrovimicrobium sediminis]|uniref:PEGA domain-containing protein n=1 Tax=Mangrovimicrobium sediminis TaxID=2562682 RepID=A0A4Z0M904_9GAMM|nr:PEGA domain-containing protein [Haliea sp. SAOS-164]